MLGPLPVTSAVRAIISVIGGQQLRTAFHGGPFWLWHSTTCQALCLWAFR